MNSEANKKLLEDIRALKSDHPNWGYRRVWAYLRRHQYKGARINHKRIYRLMKADHLLVPKNIRLKANRTRTKDKPRTEIPNEYWGIDMTKVLIPSAGWLYVHVAIDWGSKKLLSVNPSLTSKSSDWIDTLNEAVNVQFPNGDPRGGMAPSSGQRQRVPADLKSIQQRLPRIGNRTDLRQLQQPEGKRRHRTRHPHPQGRPGLASRVRQCPGFRGSAETMGERLQRGFPALGAEL